MEHLGKMIDGVYETHLPVADLRRSIAFYRDRLGLELSSEIKDRKVAFFWVGDRSTGMLGLWESGSGPLQMKLHFAFRASKEAVLAACDTLRSADIQPVGFHGEPVSEPVVLGWMPAISVYFKDPDGHSLEILSVLEEGRRRRPWRRFVFRVAKQTQIASRPATCLAGSQKAGRWTLPPKQKTRRKAGFSEKPCNERALSRQPSRTFPGRDPN